MEEAGTTRVNVSDVIDNGGFNGVQILVFIMCFLLALMDGYDSQVLGAIGPAVIASLNLKVVEFGSVFGLGALGVMAGTLAGGIAADRWGRKSAFILSGIIFGVFSIAMAFSTNAFELILNRIISSIGLGGAVPAALALTAEYTPRRIRSSVITILWAALPAGGIVGGFIAAYFVPQFGWPSVYIFGGMVPLVICVVACLILPESLAYLTITGKSRVKSERILRRLAPRLKIEPQTVFTTSETRHQGVALRQLFMHGLIGTTLLIWVVFFLSFGSMLTIVAWSTNLLRSSGAELSQASAALGWYNVGAVIASLTVGSLIDRFGALKIVTGYFLSMAVALVAVSQTLSASFGVITFVFLVLGFFTGGSNSGIMAVATMLYPVTLRGTGLGCAYACGRIGAAAGPPIVGVLLQKSYAPSALAASIAMPVAIAAVTTFMLLYRGKAQLGGIAQSA